jgi:hypothetical protein
MAARNIKECGIERLGRATKAKSLDQRSNRRKAKRKAKQRRIAAAFLFVFCLLRASAQLPGSPPLCADTSGSGTAQSCTTSQSFTPVAGSVVLYTTTTANSGTGLTVNVNALGAKSVAKWQSTTTLVAGDVAAGKQILLKYDGTNWEMDTVGNAPSGGGGTGSTGQGGAFSATNTVTGTSLYGFAGGSETHTWTGNASGITIGSGGCTASASSCPVSSTTGLPSTGGYFLFGGNGSGNFSVVLATGAGSGTLSGLTWGKGGTSAGTFSPGSPVAFIPLWISNGSDTNSPIEAQLWNDTLLLSPGNNQWNNASNLGLGTIDTSNYIITPEGIVFGNVITAPGIQPQYGGIGFFGNSAGNMQYFIDPSGFQADQTTTIALTAGSTTIAPTTSETYTTGTAATAMATITVPSSGAFSHSGFTGHLEFMGVNFTTVTGGNIANVVTASGLMLCDYNFSTSLWWCK